jgi:TatD DNase family protein
MWIDSHCHLNHAKFEGADPAALAADALAHDVSGMVSICCRVKDEFPSLLKIAQSNRGVWCTIGTHPHDSGRDDEQGVSLSELITLANSDPHIIGIGESGLDYFYDYAPRDLQERSFRKHIQACIATGLPLIVHARDADSDIAAILKEESAGKSLTGVMHCFSSSRKLAEDALELGFYISFSGIITFKSAAALQAIAKDIPADKILVETDAPFLAPIPHRGQTNKPAYVRHTGEFLANLRGVSVDEFARQTTANFFTLFNRAKPS